MTTSLLDFLQTSVPTSKVWAYVSASRLNLWSRCPKAFRLRYLDGIESAPSVSMFVGKVIHGVLEHVYRCRNIGTICTKTNLPAFVESAWASAMSEEPCFFDDVAHEEKCRQQVYDLAAAYLREIGIESEVPLAVEKRYEANLVDPLTGEDLGLPLVGIIDLLLETPDGLTIIDFKTAASASSNCAVQLETKELETILDLRDMCLFMRQTEAAGIP